MPGSPSRLPFKGIFHTFGISPHNRAGFTFCHQSVSPFFVRPQSGRWQIGSMGGKPLSCKWAGVIGRENICSGPGGKLHRWEKPVAEGCGTQEQGTKRAWAGTMTWGWITVSSLQLNSLNAFSLCLLSPPESLSPLIELQTNGGV